MIYESNKNNQGLLGLDWSYCGRSELHKIRCTYGMQKENSCLKYLLEVFLIIVCSLPFQQDGYIDFLHNDLIDVSCRCDRNEIVNVSNSSNCRYLRFIVD